MTTRSKDAAKVLVVGAGPVGLFTALSAARRGLQVELIDQNWRGYTRGHATLLHPHSLRLLGELGLGDKVRRAGQVLNRFVISVDGARVATLELPEPALAVPQTALEDVLLEAVREAGVELKAPYQATSIAQTRDHVRIGVIRRELVRLGSPVQYSEWEPVESFSWQADFVIGADGYHSGVRAALGIEAVDLNGAETFAIFEFPSAVPPSSAIELSFEGDLGATLMSLPGGRVRAAFRTAHGFDEIQDLEHLRRFAGARLPGYQGVGDSIDWGLMTHFERRLVRRFGVGRVWLAGDAAHVTSPFGGQSMNAGLREGHEYVSRIASAADAAEAKESLGACGERQTREWYRLLGVNVSFELLPHAPPWLKAHARRIVPALPATMPELDGLLEQLGVAIR
jgi:2-polyprenyl-6-methoxyphenol hydroxylase-like FAD-dependent oxidoreductase